MMRCPSVSICGWGCLFEGEGQTARLKLNWLSEQRLIAANYCDYEVCKHGMFCGHWTLQHEH